MHTLVGLSTKQNMTDQMEDGAHHSEGTLSMGSQDDHGWGQAKRLPAAPHPSLPLLPQASSHHILVLSLYLESSLQQPALQ